jgi:ATP-binding cassette subfamily F protein 3
VKSKEKMLERMERIEVRAEDKRIRFSFAPAPRSGRVVIELKGIHKSYPGSDPVFSGLDLHIERGEKVALVGPNGAGKSTLLRILGGSEPFSAGRRLADERTLVAIFAQHTTDGLNLEHTVIEEVATAAAGETPERLRGLLGSFLFRGDDVWKPVRVLSGGEKARLAIAKTLLTPVNFLLLDEPTNHLDMAGKDVLLDALLRYDGTLVLVTHDRHLIDAVATRVIEVNMGGVVRDFPGNFSDYAERLWREGRPLPGYREDPARALLARQDEKRQVAATTAVTGPSKAAAAKAARPARPGADKRERERIERERAREESRVMKTIEGLEARQAEIESELATPEVYTNGEKSRDLLREYDRVRAEIAALWDRLGGEGARST